MWGSRKQNGAPSHNPTPTHQVRTVQRCPELPLRPEPPLLLLGLRPRPSHWPRPAPAARSKARPRRRRPPLPHKHIAAASETNPSSCTSSLLQLTQRLPHHPQWRGRGASPGMASAPHLRRPGRAGDHVLIVDHPDSTTPWVVWEGGTGVTGAHCHGEGEGLVMDHRRRCCH